MREQTAPAGPGSLTPEERAAKLSADYDSTFDFGRKGGPPFLEDDIATAIRAAVAEEREACAALAEAEALLQGDAGMAAGQIAEAARIAAAIRARGGK